MSLYNYKMIIAYDGTHYGGWQIQPNAISIQELLQQALKTVLRSDVKVIGSGRTDAGVHALGQTAHFKFETEIDLYKLFRSLNSLLPHDIRVLHLEKTDLAFHARYSALSKTYFYHLCLERVQDPFKRLYCLHVKETIDRGLLKNAAHYFLGTHDFTSFANEAHMGCAAHDPIRTMKRLDVVDEEGGLRLEFEADGFLYKMVRNIVGTLLEVSSGQRGIEKIPKILDAKDRRKAGKAAPPHALFLMHVKYPRCEDSG